jgi:hypothetical protein
MVTGGQAAEEAQTLPPSKPQPAAQAQQAAQQPAPPPAAQPSVSAASGQSGAAAEHLFGQAGKESAFNGERQSKQQKQHDERAEKIAKTKAGGGAFASAKVDAHASAGRAGDIRVLIHRIESGLDHMQQSRLQHVQMKIDLASGETVRILLSLRGESLRTVLLTDSDSLRLAFREGWDGFSRALANKGVTAEAPRFSMAFQQDQGRSGQQAMEQREHHQESIFAARTRAALSRSGTPVAAPAHASPAANGRFSRFA